MEICRYFNNEINISQNYNGKNHKEHNLDKSIYDYPIDDNYGSSGQTGWFTAPCTLELVKKYQSSKTRNIWLTSTEKVKTPSGEKQVTFFVCHIDKNQYNNFKVGQIFKQGAKICKESIDANSTGYHNHVSCGFGKIKGTGWAENKYKKWCLQTTGGTQKPEDVMYVDDNIKIKNSGGIAWVKYNKKDNNVKYYKTLDDLYIRKTPNGEKVKVKECTAKMQNALKYKSKNDNAVVLKGHTITCLEEVKSGTSLWAKNYNGYICIKGSKEYMRETTL